MIARSINENKSIPMTQLIATLCDGGKKIVTASDRMVSSSDMTLTFEPEEQKAEIISDKAIILIAGTIHEPDLIRDIRNATVGKERIIDIADVAKSLFQKLRQEHIEDEILKPIGINSFEDYYKKQGILREGLTMKIDDYLENYPLGMDLLLAGIDEGERAQGHIIRIGHPGRWRSYDMLGFCSIGMGDDHVSSVFAWHKYTQNLILNEAIYITLEAKKRAECAGGVGGATDMFIIDDKGIKKIEDETIKNLEDIYVKREKNRERNRFGEEITKIGIKTSELENR